MAKHYTELKTKWTSGASTMVFFDRIKSRTYKLFSYEYSKLIVLSILLLLAIFLHRNSLAQNSPYSLSPKWMFGRQAGFDFSSGAPVNLSGNTMND
ncbi:MAG: hypothetical protein K2Q22_12710, partial [Cytophagales bacterium]|nr:hypothetical protein [Cytophagales bacterium]